MQWLERYVIKRDEQCDVHELIDVPDLTPNSSSGKLQRSKMLNSKMFTDFLIESLQAST